MRPKLDRLPTLRFELHCHTNPFLWSGKLDHAGIGRYPILGRAPNLVEWLTGGFADKVPQGNFQTRDRVRASIYVIAQRARQLLDTEWILTDELSLCRL